VIADWQAWLGTEEAAQIEFLRCQTRTGRPCGSPVFLASLEHILKRTLGPQKRGRKPKQEEADGALLLNS
jgi:hypothetical protein